GHTVPDADFRSDQRGQAYTYYLSNMTPQWQPFNGGIWSTLEKYTREWAKKYGSVQVITGTIFDTDRMQPTKRIAVATHYFKIVLREANDNEITALAFLLPHWKSGRPPGAKKKPEEVLDAHLVSIRDIHERVGVDLLPNLNASATQRLESLAASELWPRN